jgi:UDP-N-acetylglucosamine--N-acetylmuramyl-(pentapeptide) pyrophosphoryl-undecaprenol N-acetylglucosamine transferase
MKNDFKILFAGGGTGGHLFSGIAVAEEIRRRFPEARTLFVGTTYGLEKEIVPENGFKLQFIQATPLKGSGLLARIKSLLRLPRAYLQSKKILKEFQPDVVVGIGGYASGPMTLAAHFSKIPTAVIEQNSIPGFTNRQLERFADRVFIAFQGAAKYFNPKKVRFTGNPTRRLESPGKVSKDPGRFHLFVLGGSQGAHALNAAMRDALPLLQEKKDRLRIVHQTGPSDFAEIQAAYQKGGFAAEVFSFRPELGDYYAQADLMLCRAGAGTITEVQNKGVPSILIPYPFAADDHQLHNAKEMVESEGAEMILNRDLSGPKIAERLLYYMEHPEELRAMREKTGALAKPRAAEEVLEVLLSEIRSNANALPERN